MNTINLDATINGKKTRIKFRRIDHIKEGAVEIGFGRTKVKMMNDSPDDRVRGVADDLSKKLNLSNDAIHSYIWYGLLLMRM